MNIIEDEAKGFVRKFFIKGKPITIELLKERLDSKIYNFYRIKDKLDFLKVLLSTIQMDLKEHELTCVTEDCAYTESRSISIFLIEQEIEHVNEIYTFIPKSEEKFSVEEETKLHEKLNEILDRLNKQGFGQEIIFDEIESLKNHFNLGKKTWLQLAVGKIINVTSDKIIEESVAKEIISQITDMFNDSIKFLP